MQLSDSGTQPPTAQLKQDRVSTVAAWETSHAFLPGEQKAAAAGELDETVAIPGTCMLCNHPLNGAEWLVRICDLFTLRPLAG